MQHKWFLFFSVLTTVKAALVFNSGIPVKVIYDEDVTHRLYVRNLDKTTQEEQKNENIPIPKLNALKNHEERVQLSGEESLEATTHIPLDNEEEIEEKILRIPINGNPDVDLENDNNLYQNIQEIINNGVQSIKTNVKSSQEVVEPHVWNSFNEGIDNYLQSVRAENLLKQNSNSSNIVNQFQNFINNFLGRFTGQNKNESQVLQQQPQQPGLPQGGFFQNGISQIQNGINNIFSRPQTTSAMKPTVPTVPTNPTPGSVQNQNIVNNNLNPQQYNPADQISSSPNPPVQSGSTSTNQNLNPLANFPFFNILNNLNPFRQTTPKPAGSSSNPIQSIPPNNLLQPAGNPLQGVPQQIGSVIPGNPVQTGNYPLQGVGQPVGPGNYPIGGAIQSGLNPIGSLAGQGGNLIPSNPLPSGNNLLQGVAPQVSNSIPINGRK